MESKLYEEMFITEETYWWHVAKRRLVQDAIKRCKSNANFKILDAGCGTGAMLKELSSLTKNLYGADSSRNSLKYCRKRGLKNIRLVDFERKLPYHSNFFDVITCLDVLEHIDKDRELLVEFRRILKPGGKLYLTVPAYKFLWTYWDEMLSHKRRYRKSALMKMLEGSELKVISHTYFYSFLLPLAMIFRFVKSLSQKQTSDFIKIPQFLNRILLVTAMAEHFLSKFTPIPLGLSIFTVSQKS